MDINTFKQNLSDGGARPSLFEMEITFPLFSISTPAVTGAMSSMRFHCRIAEIPGTSINPVIFKYAGREVKYAGQRVYPNLNVTIINDESFTVRKGLESWMNVINSRDANRSRLPGSTRGVLGLIGQSGYYGTGLVKQFGKTGTVVRSYQFEDMFPVNLAPISLDWSNDTAIEDYTVELAYQSWFGADSSQATVLIGQSIIADLES